MKKNLLHSSNHRTYPRGYNPPQNIIHDIHSHPHHPKEALNGRRVDLPTPTPSELSTYQAHRPP